MVRVHLCAIAAIALALSFSVARSASASDMEWQFSESNEPENKGALTARLVYGVPETDNVQVMGVCDGRPSTGVKFSSLTFGADVGPDPKSLEPVDLRFTGGGFDRVVKGTIHTPESEEGIVGVHVDLEHDDPLWDALQSKSQLDYFVPGYRASTLDLTRGQTNIGKFISACRAYADAILGDKVSVKDEKSSGGNTAEKEAFAAAKELGTADAWNAFLSNYPSGFHADLARAYLKKLDGGSASAASPATTIAPPPSANGLKVTSVDYAGGVFLMNGPKSWVEQSRSGGDAFRYVETFRSPSEVKLYDKRRKVHISLNLAGNAIWYAPDGEPLTKLYDITGAQEGGSHAPSADTAQPGSAPLQTATKISCSKQGKIRSKNSDTVAKITFKNNSGAYRSILWLDFEGRPKEYSNLNAGQEITLDTFLTHPWMVTDGPGNCIEIALPRGNASFVNIGVSKPVPQKKTTSKKSGCKSGYVVIEGKCIKKQNAASYCGPGYRLQGNKCVQGYQQPKPQKQLPSWQLEGLAHGCKQGLAWNAQEGCHEND